MLDNMNILNLNYQKIKKLIKEIKEGVNNG